MIGYLLTLCIAAACLLLLNGTLNSLQARRVRIPVHTDELPSRARLDDASL